MIRKWRKKMSEAWWVKPEDTVDCSPPFYITAKKYGIKFALKILLKQLRRKLSGGI